MRKKEDEMKKRLSMLALVVVAALWTANGHSVAAAEVERVLSSGGVHAGGV